MDSRSSKNSSVKMRRTSSKEELNLNEILCLMTNNEVTQMEAEVFLEEKFGDEKVEWMKMPNQELQKLALQAKAFKKNEGNYINNKLFIREMRQSDKGIQQRLRNGALLDNLKTTIISYELLLDHTTDPEHRKAIVNAVKSLKHEHAILQQGRPSRELSKRSPSKREQPLAHKLRRIFEVYSGRAFNRARNSLFDEHKRSGLNLQNFVLMLRDYAIQREDLTRQAIIKIFQNHCSSKLEMSFMEFEQALGHLRDILKRTTPDLQDNEFGGDRDEEDPLPALDLDLLIDQGYRRQFGRSNSQRKWSTKSLAPHSGRLENELEDQLRINKNKRMLDRIRGKTPEPVPKNQSPKRLQLPSIMKISPRKQISKHLESPESAFTKESQLRQILGLPPDEQPESLPSLKYEIAKNTFKA